MSKQPLKYLRNEVIEDVTASRIRQYEAKAGVTVRLPVPIEQIVEQVLGLDFEWDEIEEQPGEQILGGLVAAERKIVLNEKHLDLFQAKPGLERSTISHEAGHWDIDIDRARLDHPTFPGFEIQPLVVKRHARKADKLIEVLFNRAMHDDRAYRLYKKLTEGQDAPEIRSAVDRYQSALLMPAWLMRVADQRGEIACGGPGRNRGVRFKPAHGEEAVLREQGQRIVCHAYIPASASRILVRKTAGTDSVSHTPLTDRKNLKP